MLYAIYLTFVFLMTSCIDNSATELSRVSNGAVDAILAIKNTDATVATPTEVYIVAKGGKLNSSPIFRADKVEGLVLIWEGESVLIIRADKARIFLKTPSIEIETTSKKLVKVTIRLEIKAAS